MPNQIQKRKLSELQSYPHNSKIRSLSSDKYEDLKAKIAKYGQIGTLLIDGRDESTILGGNHVFEILKDLGIDEANVEYRTPKDDAEALELVILHNERYANWVEDSLAELLYKYKNQIDLSKYTIDLSAPTDLKKLLARYGETEEDEAPEVSAGEPISQPGEVYQLGRHRLMCGDSTKAEDVAKLMDGKKASLIYTDPPYGVSYEGNPNGEEWDMIKNDDLRGAELFNFINAAFNSIKDNIIDNCPAYVHYASSNHIEFQKALEAVGFKMRQQIIWVKHMVIGNNDYHWSHEPILYCQFGEKRPPFYGDRTNTTVIKQATYNDLKKLGKEELLAILTAIKERSTIQYVSQDTVRGLKYNHPTQKPVAIATPFIKNSSMPDEIVVDLFGGSGTTLIAAHQLDRVAYLMEFDPKYCDVIRKRYAKFIEQPDNWQELTPVINK